MTHIPESGEKVSKNFRAEKQVITLDELYTVLKYQRSIYARHRIYPTAFFLNWPIKTCAEWLAAGWFWTIKKDEYKETTSN